MRFSDRRDAGRQLAEKMATMALVDPIVLALPRGGVPVAYEVAKRLNAPMDVFVVRKVGAPHQPEYGIGAIAEGGSVVFDRSAMTALRLTRDDVNALTSAERNELDRRVDRYRGSRALPDVHDRDVVVVDDGLATGVSAEVAVRDLRTLHPRRVVLAVPACASASRTRLAAIADAVVCVIAPQDFRAVGLWYERFDQTSDDEVAELLDDSVLARR